MEACDTVQGDQPKGSRRKNKEVTKHVAFKEEVKKEKLKNTKTSTSAKKDQNLHV